MKKATANTKINRAFRVLLILLIVALAFSGCRQKAALEKGFGYTFTPNSAMLAVRSDTDIFPINDVTLDLYYGTYDIDYCEKYNADPEHFYGVTTFQDAPILFGLYICDASFYTHLLKTKEFSDFRAIDNFVFVRELSSEEAFSKEYGFTMSYWKDVFSGQGITYNHCEKITIPAELFTGDCGTLHIQLVSFHAPTKPDGSYYASHLGDIALEYQVIDKNTIRITS